VNTCQLLRAEVWHVANSKICTKAVDKTLKTFIHESKSAKIHKKITDFTEFHGNTEIGVFHGRRPISRKMSRPWNRELGWSLIVAYKILVLYIEKPRFLCWNKLNLLVWNCYCTLTVHETVTTKNKCCMLPSLTFGSLTSFLWPYARHTPSTAK